MADQRGVTSKGNNVTPPAPVKPHYRDRQYAKPRVGMAQYIADRKADFAAASDRLHAAQRALAELRAEGAGRCALADAQRLIRRRTSEAEHAHRVLIDAERAVSSNPER